MGCLSPLTPLVYKMPVCHGSRRSSKEHPTQVQNITPWLRFRSLGVSFSLTLDTMDLLSLVQTSCFSYTVVEASFFVFLECGKANLGNQFKRMILVKVLLFFFFFFSTALNSTSKPRCRGCTTGFYCPGDGTEKQCGVSSPTEFSFGSAANCSACPEGWVSEMHCFQLGALVLLYCAL